MGMTGIPNDNTDWAATRRDHMNAFLAHNWWAMALRGIVAILFGLVAFFVPQTVMLSLALLFAAFLLIEGVFGIIAAVRAAPRHERWGWLLTEGILNLVMGAIAVMFPFAAVVAFVLVMAVWALLEGGMMLAAAFHLHTSHGRWLLAFSGIVSLIWGVVLIIAPLIGAVVLTWWLGAYAIVFGVSLLMLSFRLRARRTTPLWSEGQQFANRA